MSMQVGLKDDVDTSVCVCLVGCAFVIEVECNLCEESDYEHV